MSRQAAIDHALDRFDRGDFFEDLARRVAIPTESQNPDRLPDLRRYLDEEMIPAFEAMDFACRVFDNPVAGGGPVLLAERTEDTGLPTILSYGHGDVIRGYAEQWFEGLSPWRMQQQGEVLIRSTA